MSSSAAGPPDAPPPSAPLEPLVCDGSIFVGGVLTTTTEGENLATAAAVRYAALGRITGRRTRFGIHRRLHALAACRIAADAAILSRKKSAATHRTIQADNTTMPLASPSWWK